MSHWDIWIHISTKLAVTFKIMSERDKNVAGLVI